MSKGRMPQAALSLSTVLVTISPPGRSCHKSPTEDFDTPLGGTSPQCYYSIIGGKVVISLLCPGQFEMSRSVNEYHRLKLRSPIRDWSVHRDSVPAGAFQIQTALSIPGFSYLRLPGCALACRAVGAAGWYPIVVCRVGVSVTEVRQGSGAARLGCGKARVRQGLGVARLGCGKTWVWQAAPLRWPDILFVNPLLHYRRSVLLQLLQQCRGGIRN